MNKSAKDILNFVVSWAALISICFLMYLHFFGGHKSEAPAAIGADIIVAGDLLSEPDHDDCKMNSCMAYETCKIKCGHEPFGFKFAYKNEIEALNFNTGNMIPEGPLYFCQCDTYSPSFYTYEDKPRFYGCEKRTATESGGTFYACTWSDQTHYTTEKETAEQIEKEELDNVE